METAASVPSFCGELVKSESRWEGAASRVDGRSESLMIFTTLNTCSAETCRPMSEVNGKAWEGHDSQGARGSDAAGDSDAAAPADGDEAGGRCPLAGVRTPREGQCTCKLRLQPYWRHLAVADPRPPYTAQHGVD